MRGDESMARLSGIRAEYFREWVDRRLWRFHLLSTDYAEIREAGMWNRWVADHYPDRAAELEVEE